MTLKAELLEAAENAIVSYVQEDGTSWKQGEVLPQDETENFRLFLVRAIQASISGASAEVNFMDEQTAHVVVTRAGEEASTTYRWELGGFFDLDGDGELG